MELEGVTCWVITLRLINDYQSCLSSFTNKRKVITVNFICFCAKALKVVERFWFFWFYPTEFAPDILKWSSFQSYVTAENDSSLISSQHPSVESTRRRLHYRLISLKGVVLRHLNKSFYLKAIRRLCGAVSLFVPELSDRSVETVINEAVTHPLPLAHLVFFLLFFLSRSRPP